MSRQPSVAIVGGAGFIGRATCAALRERGMSARVIDRTPMSGAHVVDIASFDAEERLVDAFRGVQSVIHLASRVDPPRTNEREHMRALHIDGTRHVVRAAQRAGVDKLVLVSSAVVYGARPDNPVPLDENAPRRPNEDLPYAVDKAAQERVVEVEHGILKTAIARPAIVYGRGARNYLTEILRTAPVLPALDGVRPPLQFVHVDDVARSLAHLAIEAHEGVFNIAPRDWLSFEDVARIARRRIVPVPHRLVGPIVEALVRVMPPHLRAPAAMLPYLKYPFVLSATKIAQAGCAPRVTSEGALRELLARTRG
jgi:nucleoside-diphosphate-sugar epimerase